jgi:hypothetical protein
VFIRDERKYAGKKVAVLEKGEAYGEAVARLLADIEAATMITFIAANLAATS